MYDVWCGEFLGRYIWGLHKAMDYPIWELKEKYSSKYHFKVLVMEFSESASNSVPAMYNMTIFENFLVRPYFGGCLGRRITIYGYKQGLPLWIFWTSLQKCVCWDPISTKRAAIKFYSNLHQNFTKLPD